VKLETENTTVYTIRSTLKNFWLLLHKPLAKVKFREIKKDIMKIKDIMNSKAVRLILGSTMKLAAETVNITQSSDLMIIDEAGNFIGVLSEGDLIQAVIPDLSEVLSAGGSLDDACRFFLKNGVDLAMQSINSLVIKNPIIVKPEDELLKAAIVMADKQIRSLPVVSNGKLVGTVSRADICCGVLSAQLDLST
jgi:CBS domain-containing protein